MKKLLDLNLNIIIKTTRYKCLLLQSFIGEIKVSFSHYGRGGEKITTWKNEAIVHFIAMQTPFNQINIEINRFPL